MKKLLAMLTALLICCSVAFAQSVTANAVHQDWQTFPLAFGNLTIQLPADFTADVLPGDDPMFCGSWSNKGMSFSAMLVMDSLDNVAAVTQMYLGTDYNAVNEMTINDTRWIIADTVDGEIYYAYAAMSSDLCMCIVANRLESGYEMDFALTDVLSTINLAY